jgi:hypothetical protein
VIPRDAGDDGDLAERVDFRFRVRFRGRGLGVAGGDWFPGVRWRRFGRCGLLVLGGLGGLGCGGLNRGGLLCGGDRLGGDGLVRRGQEFGRAVVRGGREILADGSFFARREFVRDGLRVLGRRVLGRQGGRLGLGGWRGSNEWPGPG